MEVKVKKTLFNELHKRIYGEKSIEFALLTVGGLTVGQVTTDQPITPSFLITEIVIIVLGCLISYYFLKGVVKYESI